LSPALPQPATRPKAEVRSKHIRADASTCRCAARGRRPALVKVKIILVKVNMILTFARIIHSRVGQVRAGDRQLDVTVSASQVPLPGPVGVKARSAWSASHASHQPRHSGPSDRTGRHAFHDRSNKESLARLRRPADSVIANGFQGFCLPGSRGGAGGTLSHHRGPYCLIVLGSL
jgi:hypothetical protein